MTISLGDRVRDKISGLQGIAIARTEWLYGCVRITIQPEALHDGNPVGNHTFDEPQVELVDGHVLEAELPARIAAPAGDRPSVSRHPDPTR